MVGRGGLEPPTSRLSGVCSNHLSYRPEDHRAGTGDATRPRRRRTRILSFLKGQGVGPGVYGCIRRCTLKVRSGSGGCPQDVRTFPRKEVIQPQVPLRLPCYDFTPVAEPTVAGCLLAVGAPSSGRPNSHGVTGGVYKARERIHRVMLLRDY